MLGVFLHGCVMAMVLWPTEAARSCGGTFVTETGIIRSPRYPKPYPHNSYCVYNVLASPDARLELTCSKMNIETSIGCINDYLKVNGVIYCGKKGPKKIYGEGQLRLEFVSNGSKTKKKGFLCKFKRVTGDAYVETTTPAPTTANPTTAVPTTVAPTTATPTTTPTTAASTTPAPTTVAPTTDGGISCDSLLSVKSEWNAGWNGRVNIPIQTSITSWSLDFEFTSPLTSFEQWTGVTTAQSNTLYSVSKNNDPLSAGDTLSFEILYRFNEGSNVPTVKSIKLNGQNMCTNGGSVNSTPQPTAGSTVTMPPYTGSGCAADGSTYNYDEVLHKSLLFYEAQRSGYLPASQRVTWRKDSATDDAIDDATQQQIDLEGGYYDAGDYVKFGYPMAGMTTVLAWGAIEYGAAYTAAGEMTYMKEAVKWATDYFIKAHPEANVFYGQVGDGDLDHAFWGQPEDMTMYRPAFKITTDNPGSDLAGETAAALAATSILFQDSKPTYAATCLQHAEELYNFANQYRGKYADSISDAASFYNSWGTFDDELAWAAAWLYRATGNRLYLTDAMNHYSRLSNGISEFSWAEKTPGVQVLLAEYADESDRSTYLNDLKTFCDKIIDNTQRTPKGLVFISQWGSLRYAANVVFVCLRAADLGISPNRYREFGKQQIHYMLGDTGRSYVVGFGQNPPVRPHHSSSSCPSSPAPCGWGTYNSNEPNVHELTGALVGGPDANDNYVDKRDDYISNEVTTDYNAGFQSAVAALRQLANCGNSTNTLAPSSHNPTGSVSPTPASTTVGQSTETTTPVPPTGTNTCVQVRQRSEWQSNYILELTVTFPVPVTSWNIVLTFTDSINNLVAYTAVESVTGNSATLSNENYNGIQGAGDSYMLGMQVTYSTPDKPIINAITLNGISLCFNY